jgi:general secretion pathway protein H
VAIATGTAAHAARGFTLVEVLVVLIVIGLGAGLITLGMGHDSAATLRQESERLRSALEHAAQLAQWRRATLVWEADAGGYRFLSVAPDGLLQDETDDTLARHALPADMHLRATGPAGDAAPSRLVLRASGRNDPYALIVDSPAGRWTLRGDPLNRVRAAPTP